MYDKSPTKTAAKNIAKGVEIQCVEIHRPTLTERLKQERAEIGNRADELDAAIRALEANPDVQKIIDLVQKVARY